MEQQSFFNFRQDTRRVLMFAGGVSAALFVVLIVSFTQTASLVSSIVQLRSQLAANQLAFNQLASLQSERKQAEPLFRDLRVVFPDEEALFALTGFMEQTAQKNKVQQTFAFGAEYQGDAHVQKNIGFTLSAQSSLDNFVSYLRTLGQAPFFIDFGNLEINQSGAGYQFNTVGRILLR